MERRRVEKGKGAARKSVEELKVGMKNRYGVEGREGEESKKEKTL